MIIIGSCGTCRAFSPFKQGDNEGFCKRHAPQVVQNISILVFPIVHEYEWCSEFVDISPRDPQRSEHRSRMLEAIIAKETTDRLEWLAKERAGHNPNRDENPRKSASAPD